jgi:hypothetical protein
MAEVKVEAKTEPDIYRHANCVRLGPLRFHDEYWTGCVFN